MLNTDCHTSNRRGYDAVCVCLMSVCMYLSSVYLYLSSVCLRVCVFAHPPVYIILLRDLKPIITDLDQPGVYRRSGRARASSGGLLVRRKPLRIGRGSHVAVRGESYCL